MVGLRWGVWRPKEFPVLSRPLPPFAPPARGVPGLQREHKHQHVRSWGRGGRSR